MMSKHTFINFCVALAILLITACNNDTKHASSNQSDKTQRIYSRSLSDSISIFVSLPPDYAASKDSFAVVYILDGNFYFDIFKTIVNEYSQFDLTPEVILVGVGYKDMYELDSLRDLYYTYPVADAKYGMKRSGKADKYLQFLANELTPMIDNKYRIIKSRRTLFGHSLGGYFVDYALLKHLETGKGIFENYIAASPSLDYNGYYALKVLDTINPKIEVNASLKLFTTYGTLENEENSDDSTVEKIEVTITKLERVLNQHKFNSLKHKSIVFSNLSHMETGIPSFVQGLNWTLNDRDTIGKKQ